MPWLVGIAVLGYLIWQIEPQPLIKALYHARLIIYIPVVVVFVLLTFLFDAQNMQAVMNSLKYRISFYESLVIRGASTLITVVDYTLGMGSVVYFLNVFKRIPLSIGTTIMVFYNYINQVSLFVLGLIGFYLIDGYRYRWLAQLMLACFLLFVASVGLILLIRYANIKLVEKIKNTGLVDSFNRAGLNTYVINVIYRVCYYATYVFFFYIAVRAFQMDIPLLELVAYVPIILLVISIPVSAFGLGTSQATMLFLFKDYGSPAQILAFSLVYTISLLLLRALLGICFYSILMGKMRLERE